MESRWGFEPAPRLLSLTNRASTSPDKSVGSLNSQEIKLGDFVYLLRTSMWRFERISRP
jgi:hypothetical protein